jgi:putative ABC transport system permease protein
MAFKALKDRKLRSVLTVLGIVIGSAMIVALVASTGGLSSSVSKQIEKIGVTTITVMPTSQRNPVTDLDIETVREIAGVKEVIPYYSERLTLTSGSDSISVSLFGIEQGKLQLLYKSLVLDQGALADEYDPTGVVVGSSIANPSSGSFSPVGVNDMLVLQGMAGPGSTTTPTYSFIVKGILAPFGAAGFVNIDETVFMSLDGARMIFSSAHYSGLYVIGESPDVVDTLVTTLETYFGSNARVSSSSAFLSTVQSISSQMTLFLGSVAAVSLLVAGVGISNTMYISVMERTREIGILKAIGFRPKQILSLFLWEAAVTGLMGSIFGTLMGVGLAYLLGGGMFSFGGRTRVGGGGGGPGGPMSLSTSFSPVFSANLMIFSLLFPVAIAVLAGFYPAWRASRMNTVNALKYE